MKTAKKLLSATLVFVLVFGVFIPSTLYASDISVTVEGQRVSFADQNPVIVDGRTLVPVRGVFESLGFDVGWDSITRTVTLTRDGYTVTIVIDNANFTTNNASHTLDVPAQIIGGRTMLPIRLVLESVGYYVGWNEATRAVLVSAEPIADTVGQAPPQDRAIARAATTFGAGGHQNLSSFAILSDGNLWAWGGESWNEATQSATFNSPAMIMNNVSYISVAPCGKSARSDIYAIRANGSLWRHRPWFEGAELHIVETNDVVSVSGLYMIRADGNLWHKNEYDFGVWEIVKFMENVVAVSSNGILWGNTMAIRSDGSLWVWGSNEHGQLGNGTNTAHLYGAWDVSEPNNTPTRVPIENVVAVSVGGTDLPSAGHMMAITSNGSLWGWGLNRSGQLGDGTTTNRNSPVHIMDNVIAVSAGSSHTMAITSNGNLYAWGDNSSGQLGDGTITNRDEYWNIVENNDRHSPVRIMDNVVSVSAGWTHTLALRADGSLWAWGQNTYGQLGDGTTENRLSPVRVMDNVQLP